MKNLFIAIGLVFLMTAELSAQNQAENKNAAVITFDKKLLDNSNNPVWDYGTIFKDSNGDSYFAFKNTGKEPLILSEVRSSCGCTVPKWPREPILPGKSDTIKVKYSTNRLGIINKTITVFSNAQNNPIVLRISGNVVERPAETMPMNQNSAASPVSK